MAICAVLLKRGTKMKTERIEQATCPRGVTLVAYNKQARGLLAVTKIPCGVGQELN